MILFFASSVSRRTLNATSLEVKETDDKVLFLRSLKDFSSDYTQITYTESGKEYANGELIIKTPNKIMIKHKTKMMNLTIVSIDGILKAFDENVRQVTYVENQYNDLLKLFSKEINVKYLHYNLNNELCMVFKNQDSYLDGCLDIDRKNDVIRSLSLYAIVLPKSLQKDKKTSGQNVKTGDIKTNDIRSNNQGSAVMLTNDELAKSTFVPIVKLAFSNIKINKGVKDSVFEIKDNRIFDEDD